MTEWPIETTETARRLTVIGFVALAAVASGCKSKESAEAKPHASSALTAMSAARVPPEPPHPATLFAPDQAQAAALRIDGGFVYWKTENLETEKASVLRVPTTTTGAKIESVVKDEKSLTSFTTGEGAVYWSVGEEGRYGVYTKPLSGGGAKRLATRSTWAEALYVDSGNVYWSEFGSLFRVSTKGGAVSRLYERQDGPGGIANTLTGADGEIYWSLDDALLTVRSDGSSFRKLATGFQQVRALAVDATSVYVADAGDGTVGGVYRVDRKGGLKTAILAPAARPWSVYRTGAHVYVVSNAARGPLWRVNPDGTGLYVFATDLTYGTAVVCDDRAVYWTTAEPGALWKAWR